MRLTPTRANALTWVLIYGGLFVVCLGVALQRNGAAYGWGVVATGAAVVVAGIAMVWVRSRLREH